MRAKPVTKYEVLIRGENQDDKMFLRRFNDLISDSSLYFSIVNFANSGIGRGTDYIEVGFKPKRFYSFKDRLLRFITAFKDLFI
jgi:hypothetical protein